MSLKNASKVRVMPKKGKGKGEMVPLDSKWVSSFAQILGAITDTQAPGADKPTYSFIYQRDTYVLDRTLRSSLCSPGQS
jgi:cation-transporting ATPase 13A1